MSDDEKSEVPNTNCLGSIQRVLALNVAPPHLYIIA